MNLPEIVDATFAPEGALAKANPSYKLREGQLLMARAVAQTLSDGGALVVEAGTGVGKTFAYLIPALLSGERILVSTATKALQDQIFFRDLPFLRQALGISLQAALLKGAAATCAPTGWSWPNPNSTPAAKASCAGWRACAAGPTPRNRAT